MDYRRIYRHFIQSRLAREANLLESGAPCERHRIVPRYEGGTSSDSNVIRLARRDHVFAHAVLLKRAQGQGRWHAAASLLAVLDARPNPPEVARRYRWARCLARRVMCGRLHPGRALDKHRLFHVDGRAVSGDRQDLVARTGLPARVVYDLVNGQRDFADGWCASEEERACRLEADRIRATRGERVGARLFHLDGRVSLPGDRHGPDRRTRLRVRQHGFADGWCADPEEARARSAGRWRRAWRELDDGWSLFQEDVFEDDLARI